jgi:hypothetical protein
MAVRDGFIDFESTQHLPDTSMADSVRCVGLGTFDFLNVRVRD